MSELERVAKAISDAEDTAVTGVYEKMARAAVLALKDPSDQILLSIGQPYGGSISQQAGLLVRRDAWNTMIDAILSEGDVT